MTHSNDSSFADSILNGITSERNNLTDIRSRLIQAKKIQLHSGIEGFQSPDAYGVYRHTGGQPLGVVGSVFEPCNLNLFMDSIESSVLQCGNGLDLSKLTYTEYKEGAKVSFCLPHQNYQIKSPMVGDILATKLMFSTGFDGLTKLSLHYMTERLWCSNGARSWKSEIGLSMRNTANNHLKVVTFCDEIFKCIEQTDAYVIDLNRLCKIEVNSKMVDDFILKLTGFEPADLKKETGKRRAILDRINASMAIEFQNTQATAFSMLQGITRYTTHDLAKGNEEALLFNTAADMNKKAHQLLLAN